MPTYAYNRIAAVAYAKKWAKARNPTWPNFSDVGFGGDCTNFISQCLYAGGWNMLYSPFMASPMGWYSRPQLGRGDHSLSWTSADNFQLFLRYSNRARQCNFEELTIGDLIAENIKGHGIRHWMLVTGRSPQTEILLSYHSADFLDTGINDVQKRMDSEDKLFYWKVNDTYYDEPLVAGFEKFRQWELGYSPPPRS